MTKKAAFSLVVLAVGALVAGCGSGSSPGVNPSNAASIPKYVEPLVIPPVMPPMGTLSGETYYEIAVKQFKQQVLPAGYPKTTVWGYGKADDPATFNFPAFTVEAEKDVPVRVKWINGLVDGAGNYLPYFLPVDPTIHWADPAGAMMAAPPYSGPVPIVTHVHGAHVEAASDGHPEAWYLPAAANLPGGIAKTGPHYTETAGATHEDGAAFYRYTNDQPATTLWYHDHALGVTRLNVYAGMAGFWILRDPVNDLPDLPGPAPKLNDPAGTKYYEIPIAIQDRSFKKDGSFFYPDSRAFFDGYTGPYLPDAATVPPVWNPEFFGETIVVNGKTWPYLNVEPRKYRLRLLNGCNARFLILGFDATGVAAGLNFKVIGNEGGLFPDAPLTLDQLVMSPAERFDVIVDFSTLPVGSQVVLLNTAPDEPFKGLNDPENGPAANPDTTGQIMKFKVVASTGADASVSPATLPAYATLDPGGAAQTRDLTINEVMHLEGAAEYPKEAVLGSLAGGPLLYADAVTETPTQNTDEIWRIVNLTGDAHPIHLHLTHFNVLGRTPINVTAFQAAQDAYLASTGPLPVLEDYFSGPTEAIYDWEKGFKETVTAPPGMVTSVIARFDLLGDYVWHCHILEHEDNEMMRPFTVVAPTPP